MARALKFLSVAMMLAWFVAMLYGMMALSEATAGSSIAQWYATIAGLNAFTFLALAVVPFMILFLPFGMLAEWIGDKGDAIEERARQQEAARVREAELATRPPRSPPVPPTDDELSRLREATKDGERSTAEYLSRYFGPDGPKPLKPRPRTRRR